RIAKNRRQSSKGVTLIEMLVVVTILGLFAAIVAPSILGKVDPAKHTAAKTQIHQLELALANYKLDTGRYPSVEQGLRALRERPEGEPAWNGPYVKQDIPLDPWGHPYLYKYPGDHNDEPDLVSLGADGQPGGEGNNADIVSWKSN